MPPQMAIRTITLLAVGFLLACRAEQTPTFPVDAGPIRASLTGTGPTRFYASPTGLPGNSGTISSPWDLKTALGKTGTIEPDDTLFLRGGTYNVPSSTEGFISTLEGTNSNFVIVVNYPGETPVLDGANLLRDADLEVLRVRGPYAKYMRLVIRDSYSANRTSERPHLLVNAASHTYYSELFLHDGGNGFYNFADRTDVLLRGCVIYNSGFQSDPLPDHAIYVKSNATPPDPGVRIEFNMVFNQFGYGVHAYSDEAGEGVRRITIHGNTIFNSGSLDAIPQGKANVIIGVGNAASGLASGGVSSNLTYKSTAIPGPNLYIGYEDVQQDSVSVSSNYAAGGTQVVEARYWNKLKLLSNTFVGTSQMVALRNTNLSGLTLTNNKHSRWSLATAWTLGTTNMPFSNWRVTVGAGSDQVVDEPPTINVVSLLGVEPGRLNVTLYNWENASSFSFTPLPYQFFSVGDSIEVRHVFNLFGAPIAGGRCCSAIQVPVTNVSAPVPYGMSGPAPSPGTQFAAYVVTKFPR